MDPVERTHGRWPWVAAALAVPASVAFLRRAPRLEPAERAASAALPAVFWHQTEEWVVPGGFRPWFNRSVMGSSRDEYPIRRRDGLLINAGLGWAFGTAGSWAARRHPIAGATVLALTAGNAAMHVREAVRQRHYNPGLATSVALFAPIAAVGLARIGRERPLAALTGAALGLGGSAAMFRVFRSRVAPS